MIAAFTPAAETIAAWVLIACAGLWMLSAFLVSAICWIDMRDQRRLAREAADHNEPTRAQVEWELDVAQAIRIAREDALAQKTWAELEFAATLADIAGLPEVRRG